MKCIDSGSLPESVTDGFNNYKKVSQLFSDALKYKIDKVINPDTLKAFLSTWLKEILNNYNEKLTNESNHDSITCFSAYMLGACGPDFWTVTSKANVRLGNYGGKVPDTAGIHFDLGHYNRTHAQFQTAKAGLGAIPAFWKQRLVYAGTYDETWQTTRFPLPPLDMNPLFHNAVPQDQVYRPRLGGHEKLTLFNLHPSNPELTLNIPRHTLAVSVRIGAESLSKPLAIDTCLIEPDEQRLTLTCAARFPLSMDSRYVKSIHFTESEQNLIPSATRMDTQGNG